MDDVYFILTQNRSIHIVMAEILFYIKYLTKRTFSVV